MNRNRNFKKKMVAGLAVGMAGIMGAMPVCAAEKSPIVSKEETVYVNANANGDETKIIVSDWLKNAGVEETLKDKSELTGIKNVKGEETFAHTEGEMIWNTDGKDIYYQGTSKKELPVSVRFTYYLDGKKMDPKDIKGKSGKLKIRIDYKNHAKTKADIDGKKEKLYSPFVMVTGMIFPEETFSNVMIDNGKVISDGSRNMVLGVGMPGLKESLGLNDKKASSAVQDLSLPESLEVTADVKNFTMEPTFTVALSDLLKDLKPDDTKDLDSVADSLKKLEDAALQLVDGSAELSKGADTLGSSYKEFDDGVGTLKSGIDVLKSGVSELSGGINEYTNGADTLNAGIQEYMGKDGALNVQVTEYVDGVNQIVKGVEDYTDGTIALADGVKSYIAGEEQIAKGAGQLTVLQEGLTEVKTAIVKLHEAVDGEGNPSEDLYAASQELAAGTKKLNDSLASMESMMGQVDALTAAGKELTEQAGNMSAEVQSQILDPTENLMRTGLKMMESLQSVTAQLESMKTVCQNALNESGANLVAQVNGQIDIKNTQIGEMRTEAEGSNGQIDAAISQLNEQIARANEKGDTQTAEALLATVNQLSAAKMDTGRLSGLEHVETVQMNVDIPTQDFSGLQAAVIDIQTQFTSIQNAFQGLAPQLLHMNSQLDQLSSMHDQIPAAPFQQLQESVSRLNMGMQGLNGGIGTLSSNLGMLDQKTDSLPEAVKGIEQLNTGLGELSKANPKLLEGAKMLKANTPSLVDGVHTLSGGTDQLNQGLSKLGGELSGGSQTLAANSAALRDGASRLLSGTDELVQGSGTLQTGSKEVASGIRALQDGAHQLKDGTEKFNKEGIGKLQDTADELLGSLVERMDALTSDTCSYDSYAGKSDDMDGSVKFIIETEAIE